MKKRIELKIKESAKTLEQRQLERAERRLNKNKGRREGKWGNSSQRKIVCIDRKEDQIKENLERVLSESREKIHAVEIFKLLGI